MKEYVNKQIVNLKRAPHRIPTFILFICCVIYTFSLTEHSDTSMYVSSSIIAFYVFVITLSSMLAIFSYINAYPKDGENKKMLIVAIFLVVLQIFLGVLYLNILFYETTVRANPVPVTPTIAKSMNMTMIHIGSLIVALAAIFLKPVYQKMLLKIDTSSLDSEESSISDYTSIHDEYPDEDELDF